MTDNSNSIIIEKDVTKYDAIVRAIESGCTLLINYEDKICEVTSTLDRDDAIIYLKFYTGEKTLHQYVVTVDNAAWTEKEVPTGNDKGLSTALDNNHYSVEIAGREYRCTKIGNQLWMSENLDAEVGTLGTDETTEGANEWYYNYDEAFAKSRNYGRLYTWNNLNENLAGKLADWGLVTEDGKGWHWPSKEDFEKLMENINEQVEEGYFPTGGIKLKSSDGYVQGDSLVGGGDDLFGISLVPGGGRYHGDGTFYDGSVSGFIVLPDFSYDRPDSPYCFIVRAFDDRCEISNVTEGYLDIDDGFGVRLILDLNPDGTIPDDFKSFVKIKSASAAENLIQSNTIHTPGVFTVDDLIDDGTPISQVFEQYKTSGSLRVLTKDNSDTEVVCEATVDIIHASAGDTMMLWIDNPDVPNGKILYELDDGMTEWPEPTYFEPGKTPIYTGSVDSETLSGNATLGAMTDFGTLSLSGASVSIKFPQLAPDGILGEGAFTFKLSADNGISKLTVLYGGSQTTDVCKLIGAPEEGQWKAGTYQVTMVNGCAVVGVFE